MSHFVIITGDDGIDYQFFPEHTDMNNFATLLAEAHLCVAKGSYLADKLNFHLLTKDKAERITQQGHFRPQSEMPVNMLAACKQLFEGVMPA